MTILSQPSVGKQPISSYVKNQGLLHVDKLKIDIPGTITLTEHFGPIPVPPKNLIFER